MARNIPKKGDSVIPPEEAQESSVEVQDEEQSPEVGGALGVLPDSRPIAPAGGRHIIGSAKRASATVAPAIKKFRVVGSTGRHDGSGHPLVMYESSVTRLSVGKVYGENEVDLDLLRAQGVLLEEILVIPEVAIVPEKVDEE